MIDFREIFDNNFRLVDGVAEFESKNIDFRNDILRFSPDITYSTGNFSALRDKHARLQFDSVNGTTDRLDTILARTNWPKEFFNGKLILECGCGAGPDTEILLSLGARVVSVDIAGCDICKKNIGENDNSLIVQASILDLPFRKQSFDIVWCHRVIQHTPNPEAVLRHILRFAKPKGAVFVHSYSDSLRQVLSWKYFLRPFARRIDPEKLYRIIQRYAPYLYRLTNRIRRVKPDRLGKILFYFSEQILPIRNYRFKKKFEMKDDEFILEYAIHDTFDALSPSYDEPLKPSIFKNIASEFELADYEVTTGSVTLLRTVVRA